MTNRRIMLASSRVLTRNARQKRQKQQFDVQVAKKEHTFPSEKRTKRPLPRANFIDSAIALLTAFTHSSVALLVLGYGMGTANLMLIYIACFISVTDTGPAILSQLFSLIKENLPPKKAEK